MIKSYSPDIFGSRLPLCRLSLSGAAPVDRSTERRHRVDADLRIHSYSDSPTATLSDFRCRYERYDIAHEGPRRTRCREIPSTYLVALFDADLRRSSVYLRIEMGATTSGE